MSGTNFHQERGFLKAAIAASSLFLAAGALAQATVAGNTPAEHGVSPMGAATYRIPIQVPPGVAGMEPKLALSYSSQSGNGALGIGWSLDGFGAISRCPRTMATDGSVGPVNYDIHDRLCLDGERLIIISGAYYGQAGSEYRTERESFSKIVANGVAGVGPASFTVQTKAGLTMEFGGTPDSRVEVNGKATVRLWALNKLTDTRGNTMTFSYVDDAPNGQAYPLAVTYGGSTVSFEYEARADAWKVYANDGAVRTNLRLKAVKTSVAQTAVKEYRLSYDRGPWSGKSRLASVTECSPATSECLRPLAFSYGAGSIGATNVAATGHSNGGEGSRLVDLFGDGRKVYWTRGGQSHFGTRLNPDGTSQSWNWVGHAAAGEGWEFVDLFGEGRQVYWTRGGQNHYGTRLNADGTSQSWNWTGMGTGGDGWQFADLFGDGRPVYWTRGGQNHYATRLNPDGTAQSWQWVGHGTGGDGWELADLFGDGRQVYWTRGGQNHYATRLNADGTAESWHWMGHGTGDDRRLVDLFGDGRKVFWVRAGNLHHATRLNADGTVQTWQWNGWGLGADGWDFADLFGDGRSVYWTRTGSTHHATRLNPDGTSESWSWQGHGTGGAGWRLVDLFGDGRQVYWTRGGTNNQTHYVTRMNPDGTAESWEWVAWGTGGDGWDFADLFGDGRQVYWTRGGSTHYTSALSKGVHDLLASVSTGGAAQPDLAFSYVPLSLAGNSVYVNDAPATYPVVNLQVPLHVVSSIGVADGLGGQALRNYQYGGWTAEHRTGRGSRGFRWTRTSDARTGMESLVEYRQDWPFTGLVAKTEARRAGAGNNGLLKRSSNTYAQATGAGVIRTFPYLAQSLEESWDADGTALPTLRTDYQYSQALQFGDPTQVTVTSSDGSTKTNVNEYWPANISGGKWIAGRLKKATVTSHKP